MLNENKAREIVESIKDESVGCINYLGIQMVPSNNKIGYELFPEELKSKVYVFEASDINKMYVICQYFVDCNGSIYKETYEKDLKCIKIK
ncbi:hypothetical protein LGK95_21920 [Clostridium algoriphilum]|uniref:hypothetical protein n=1 Tax=Clostridium algoriphilum TaxID=198347 RepID=UPI001CF512FE|nr:hypothetical protein [Clostridium algoriphilum]MCB2296109.1 hypothetical protein [Clostridium algoriphilum]